jgi:hypothetical protein
MFPEYKSLSAYTWNRCVLTPRQHFIAHWLLFRAYRTRSCAYAFRAMANGQSNNAQCRIKSKQYARNIKEVRQIMSDANKGKSMYKDIDGTVIRCNTDDPRVLAGDIISLSTGRTGYRHPTEHKKKMSELMREKRFNKNKTIKLYFLEIKIEVLYHSVLFVELLEQGWSSRITSECRTKHAVDMNKNMSKESRLKAAKSNSIAQLGKKREPTPLDKLKPKLIYCFNELANVFEMVNEHTKFNYQHKVFTKGRIIFNETRKRHCSRLVPTPPGYFDEPPNTIHLYYDTVHKCIEYLKIKEVQDQHMKLYIPNGGRVKVALNGKNSIYLTKDLLSTYGMPVNCVMHVTLHDTI